MTTRDLEDLFDHLFPIDRSITGEGYRESLDILKEWIPFDYLDIDSGTQIFDWQVPEEWQVEEAYLIDPSGEKILDYRTNNLHILNYSAPVDALMDLEELKEHLHSIPELPDAVPYVTSYYKRAWGFCISHNQLISLRPGKYRVIIKSSFKKGHIRIGEYVLPGNSSKEILLTSYLCHPSMANNELGGPLAIAYIYSELKKLKKRQFTYRFVINPETIGSLAYLSEKAPELQSKVVGGIVLNCLGGPKKKLSYKYSKYADSLLDNFFSKKEKEGKLDLRDFSPFGGSDERQYNSPGISLPIGQLARTIYEEHPEYHNSLDTKGFMDLSQLEKSCKEIVSYLLEIDQLKVCISTKGFGEPFLSRHNLYPSINSNITRKEHSGDSFMDGKRRQRVIMNILSFSDGKNSIIDIAARIEEDPEYVEAVAEMLVEKNLIRSI